MVHKSQIVRNSILSLNGEFGDVTLTSSGGTVAITTPTANTINLEASDVAAEKIANKVDVLGTPNSTNYPSTTLLNSQIIAANNFAIAMAVSL